MDATVLRVLPAVVLAIPVLSLIFGRLHGLNYFSLQEVLLLAIGALCLWVRHKTAWVLSMVCLAAVGVAALVALLSPSHSIGGSVGIMKFVAVLIAFGAVGTLTLYFRYPYLDRRQRWAGATADRYAIKMSVKINDKWQGETEDISYQGARVRILGDDLGVQVGDSVQIELSEACDLICCGIVVAIEPPFLRMNFDKTSGKNKDLLRQWLITQPPEKKV